MRTTSSALLLVLLLDFAPGGVASRAAAQVGPEPPTARVVVLTVALYNEQANVREESDTLRAVVATEMLRGRLAERMGPQLVPFAVVDSLAASIEMQELAGGLPCNV